MDNRLPFLDPRVPIVDEAGRPTSQFALDYQNNFKELSDTIETALDAEEAADDANSALADKVPETREVIAGDGLEGGGPLSADVTLSLQRIIEVVADLPAPTLGLTALATDALRAGELAGAGTGCPVWADGTDWRTYYDNSVAAA